MRKTQIADILKPEYDKLYLLKFNEIKMEENTMLLLLSKKHKLSCQITAHEHYLIFFVPSLASFKDNYNMTHGMLSRNKIDPRQSMFWTSFVASLDTERKHKIK